MPNVKAECPECEAPLALADTVTAGKRVRCPKCQTVFPVNLATTPAGPEPGERRPVRRKLKRKRPQGLSSGAVAAIVGGCFFALAGAAGLGVYLLVNRGGATVANRHRVPDVVPPAGIGTNIGQLVPEIEGQDTDGVKFKLSDYRGKVVVLDFWGHW